MARKKLITYDSYSECSTLTFGANEGNTRYTIGGEGEVYVSTSLPDILYQSVVLIRDEARMWMRGSFVTLGMGGEPSYSIKTSIDNDPFIDNVDPKTVVCEVKSNLGVDVTGAVSAWKIERISTDANADAVWAQRDKVKNFLGGINLYWSDDVEINDIDLNSPTTKFKITATIGKEEVTTVLSI